MSRGVFVTGTDTGVGKTLVSAALVVLCRARGPVRYCKPIQTGIEHSNDTADVARLAACTVEEIVDAGIRLPRPVSPHLAAHLAGTSITVESLMASMREATGVTSNESFWIVEGAGGVLVPLNDDQLMIDLMVRLALPVVVVARTALGTINHTLLTLDALRRRDIDIAFVVMSGEPDAAARQAIALHGRVRVEALPRLAPPGPQAVAAWAAASGSSWPI